MVIAERYMLNRGRASPESFRRVYLEERRGFRCISRRIEYGAIGPDVGGSYQLYATTPTTKSLRDAWVMVVLSFSPAMSFFW